jgi:hypothetical protein
MALVKCKECGKEISKEAKVCPSCGARQKKKLSKAQKIVIGLIVLGGVVSLIGGNEEKENVSKATLERNTEVSERMTMADKLHSEYQNTPEGRRCGPAAVGALVEAQMGVVRSIRAQTGEEATLAVLENYDENSVLRPVSVAYSFDEFGDCVYEVRSFFDKEDNFGNTIRRNYYAKLKIGVEQGIPSGKPQLLGIEVAAVQRLSKAEADWNHPMLEVP